MRRPQREQDKGGVLGEYGLNEEQGNEIIMAARAHWFEGRRSSPNPKPRRPPMRTPPNERLTSDIAEPVLPDTSGSERRCILSGDNAPRDMLVRLAISPDGLVLPDVAAKAPGRGAWIGVSRAALETALTEGHLRRALMRAFKGAPLTIPR